MAEPNVCPKCGADQSAGPEGASWDHRGLHCWQCGYAAEDWPPTEPVVVTAQASETWPA